MITPRRLALLTLFPAGLVLAGCNAFPPGPNTPVSMQPLNTYVDNHPPEPINGLPRGASVISPLIGNTGQLNSVPVGPAVPGAAPVR